MEKPLFENAGVQMVSSSDTTKTQNIHYAMSNSFGFGGTNASIVFRKF
jgi:3-oxoacyl-(acyl-carrier-protein) synthase